MITSLARQIPGRDKESEMSTYLPWQQRLLRTVDANVDMFKRYGPSCARTVEELQAGRQAAVASFEGQLAWSQVPWCVRELAMDMPAWGISGT